MLAKNYSYTVEQSNSTHTVLLVDTETGNVKKFVMSGKSTQGIVSHMDSLSDACCDDFFGKKQKR